MGADLSIARRVKGLSASSLTFPGTGERPLGAGSHVQLSESRAPDGRIEESDDGAIAGDGQSASGNSRKHPISEPEN